MSEPVTNHDIEDVLSSIRRLVAQGTQPPSPEAVENTDHPTESAPSDRLVLTPAFRVGETIDDSSDAETVKMPPEFAPRGDKSIPDLGILDRPATAEVPNLDISDRASLEATIAELETAVTEVAGDWEPDGSEHHLESSVTSAFLDKLDARQAKVPEQTVTDAVTDHIADTIVEEVALGLSDALDAQTVAQDTEFSRSRHDAVYDPVAEATADAAEREPGDVFGDELAPDVDPTIDMAVPPVNGQLIDPDALRVLIGDMIREELQGNMGERITHNVRKLVRREINRVLTEQEV